MDKAKKHSVAITVVLALLVIVYFAVHGDRKNYSLADFGVPPLIKPDCSSVSNTNVTSPVSVSFNAPNVSDVYNKIKTLITKYNGHITSDSFNSYPSSDSKTPSQDNASVTVTFDKSQVDFLTELSSTVKNAGGVNTNYNYTDGNPSPYNTGYSSYSSYSTCVTMMQNVQTDVMQLELFIKALKEEHSPQNIAFLSQSISTVKSTLQTDVNNMNSFFGTSDKPSVSISINTLYALTPMVAPAPNNQPKIID